MQGRRRIFFVVLDHRHRRLGRSTPLERWKATPSAVSLGVALPGPGKRITAVVDGAGRPIHHFLGGRREHLVNVRQEVGYGSSGAE